MEIWGVIDFSDGNLGGSPKKTDAPPHVSAGGGGGWGIKK